MNRIRLLFALLTLSGVLAFAGSREVTAQDATPIPVASPTAAGCDQIGAYVEARQKIMDELIAGIAAIFPGIPTPIAEHGAELSAAMLVMTPEQTAALAEVYRDTADKIEILDVPEFAASYNELIVILYRTSADAFAKAANTDLVTASQEFSGRLGAVATAVSTYGDAALGECPAFQDVLTVDQTQVGA